MKRVPYVEETNIPLTISNAQRFEAAVRIAAGMVARGVGATTDIARSAVEHADAILVEINQ